MPGKRKVAPEKTHRGGRKPILKVELVAAALTRNRGNLSRTAKQFGVSRAAVQKLVAKNDLLKQVLDDAREEMLDNAENSLQRAIDSGEGWAVCFCLKTRGKSRGYIERQEFTGADGGPIQKQLSGSVELKPPPDKTAFQAFLHDIIATSPPDPGEGNPG